ncbi:hypothetical protein BT96DRAFT_1022955 [Gymnopus androsaceus JB14]|uniref:Uncharacterized protein n=1 Tax=Gymnopus androsaceus JB14 TaxID=1447944 RepID=A0A6A4H8W5_9AGAR|nr:hypothetical protein BT96DRAFT_1022955 [Gymnopus androsaceus JB14]
MDYFALNIDPLLHALSYTKDHHDLLPNLTTLTIHAHDDPFAYGLLGAEDALADTMIFPEELTAMILSRWWPDESELNHGVDIDEQAFDRNGLQRLQKVFLKGYRNALAEIASVSGLTGLDVELCKYTVELEPEFAGTQSTYVSITDSDSSL